MWRTKAWAEIPSALAAPHAAMGFATFMGKTRISSYVLIWHNYHVAIFARKLEDLRFEL